MRSAFQTRFRYAPGHLASGCRRSIEPAVAVHGAPYSMLASKIDRWRRALSLPEPASGRGRHAAPARRTWPLLRAAASGAHAASDADDASDPCISPAPLRGRAGSAHTAERGPPALNESGAWSGGGTAVAGRPQASSGDSGHQEQQQQQQLGDQPHPPRKPAPRAAPSPPSPAAAADAGPRQGVAPGKASAYAVAPPRADLPVPTGPSQPPGYAGGYVGPRAPATPSRRLRHSRRGALGPQQARQALQAQQQDTTRQQPPAPRPAAARSPDGVPQAPAGADSESSSDAGAAAGGGEPRAARAVWGAAPPRWPAPPVAPSDPSELLRVSLCIAWPARRC